MTSDRLRENEQSEATSYTRPIGSDEGLAMAVVSSIAEMTGAKKTELTPLFDAVDPDALKRLTQSDRDTRVQVVFDYDGHRVAVDNDRIRVQSR
jgi:hypothetical protein